jgi:hypothetical protein
MRLVTSINPDSERRRRQQQAGLLTAAAAIEGMCEDRAERSSATKAHDENFDVTI